MKNVLVAFSLLVSTSAPALLAASLPAPETSIVPGAPTPVKMACSLGSNANDDYVTTAKNTPVTFSPLWNDDDTPQQNFGGIVTGPQHGTAQVVGLDLITYTPAPGYTGSDSIVYLHEGCFQCWGSGWQSWCSEPSSDYAVIYITVTN